MDIDMLFEDVADDGVVCGCGGWRSLCVGKNRAL